LFFSELDFKWDQQLRALVTTGELSLNSIDKFKIERKINGRIQIIKKRTGDDVVIYLESPEGSWYYFKYQKGIMYALSSDKLFNQYVRDNMDKLSKKYDNYKLRLGNIADRNKFVRIYKTDKRK
jgi:Mor family transcriptional regulator